MTTGPFVRYLREDGEQRTADNDVTSVEQTDLACRNITPGIGDTPNRDTPRVAIRTYGQPARSDQLVDKLITVGRPGRTD